MSDPTLQSHSQPIPPDATPTSAQPVQPDRTPTPAAGQSQLLTTPADEQMALFEKELQENDWGHQPC